MERLSRESLRSILEFVRGAYAARDLNAFVDHCLHQLSRVVRSDLTVYGELNHRRRRYRMIGNPAGLMDHVGETFRVFAQQHPFTQTYRGGGDGSAVKISDLLSRSAWHKRGIYQEAFRVIDIEHEMVVWLPARRSAPLEITFAVHRRGRDFSEADRLRLDVLRPHLLQAYDAVEALTELRDANRRLGEAHDASARAVVLLDAGGGVEYASRLARELLEAYFGASAIRRNRLPDSVSRWVADQVKALRFNDDVPMPRQPMSVDRDGRHLVLRLAGASNDTVILEEHSDELAAADLKTLGLTPREAEVLLWIAHGKTNAAIATILAISVSTAERHVESILRKVGVENRTAAAALAWECLARNASGGPQEPRAN